jgi:acetyltransferase-like isoleucine patch superfamily enzyme
MEEGGKTESGGYLRDKIYARTKSSLVCWMVEGFIHSSRFPVIDSINTFISNKVDHHLYTFVNGSALSRHFKKCGAFLRVGLGNMLLCRDKIEIGDYVVIGNYVSIYNQSDGGCVKIGSNTHISDFTIISGVGGVEIGNDVAISSRVSIYSHSNDYKDRTRLVREQIKRGKVLIGDNVLIGTHSVILPGIRVGKNSVVGAGTIVTRDVPDNCVVDGNPARIRRSLKAR